MTYRIRTWEKHFENNRTKDMKVMQWVPVPNKHDGEGFLTIMAEKDGINIYGCWHLILQVASKSHPRGTLLRDDGTPLDARAIALKSGWRKADDIQRALDFCSSTQVGWIEVVTSQTAGIPHPPAEKPQEPAWNGMEGNGIELNEGNGITTVVGAETPPPLVVVQQSKRITWDGNDFVGIVQADADLWYKAYPAVDIKQEIARAEAWLKANPTKIKANYARFLTNWFARSQEKGGTR